jgi:peptide/nickel transport system permease protein
MPLARIIRGVVLSLKEKEFVEAARASGASDGRIIFVHIMPNAVGPMIVNATLTVAAAIITESALSFLGFGVQPPTPTWGNLLNGSRQLMTLAPWLVWFPGLAILITVLAVNFLGDGLRDALDPHQKLSAKE